MVELDKTQSSDKKLLLLAGFMFSCLFVLAAGLWRVQVMQSKQYVDRMNDQYKVLVRVPPVRGKIFDAQNLPLAENRPSFTINLYFEELRELWREEYFKLKKARLAAIESEEKRKRSLRSKERDEINKQARFNVIERVVSELGVIMGEDLSISREDFEKHYIQQLSMPLPVMTDVSLAHATRFLESSSLPAGFEIDYQPMRTYPYGDLASQTLGFVRRKKEYSDKLADNTKYQLPDYEGIAGLESHFDEDLRGTPGIKNVTVNYLGYCIGESIATPPKPGKNLYLTLDADIQRVAQEAIATANGPDTKGAVVVMDSYSGDLIALASNPGFNPNDFVPQISSQKYNDYLRAEDPTFKTFRNRCVSERYQPGSVFKIVVSMGLLESDFFNPDEIIDTMWVYASGSANSGIRIKDTAAPGQYNFIRAFKKSSNYYFVEMGLKLGRESMVNISKRLGFDQRTQLPIMQGAAGIIPSDEYLSKHRIRATTGLTANLSIGQGEIDVTPLHIAQLMACIANNGRIPQPRLVSAIESQA
ncbi:MAG: hypothetical protein LR011_07845, partial [Verrucomicrobia bacterium]|nr:hypothetical protein [Verrucomicrobiota bacterium]